MTSADQPLPTQSKMSPSGRASTVLWWALTLLTLVILDDLTFGPVFWVTSRIGGPWMAFTAALAVYVPAQVLLVWAATSGSPGRVASWFLARLDLQRRSSQVGDREMRVRAKVGGTASALALSMVIGGVLPPLVLWRNGHPVGFVRVLSIFTATIYALEFAVIHGLLPGSI